MHSRFCVGQYSSGAYEHFNTTMQTGLSRRSFLFFVGASLLPLGTFRVPALSENIEYEIDEKTREYIRRIVGPVNRISEDPLSLTWLERNPESESGYQAMIWCASIGDRETYAEISRFYEAITWRSWRLPEDLKKRPLTTGPWVVRLASEGKHFEPKSWLAKSTWMNTDETKLVNDPREAWLFPRDGAIHAALALQNDSDKRYGVTALYWDPVPLADELSRMAVR